MHPRTPATYPDHGDPGTAALTALRTAPDLAAAAGASPDTSAFRQRFRFEHAWLAALPGLTGFAAAALAARAAASQPALPASEQLAPDLLAPLRAATPDLASLQATLRALGLPDTSAAPTPHDLACLAAAWPWALAVETLLASGGDDRLTLDPATLLNRYGCAPWPRPEVVGFASCTASSLAEAPFHAAERARRALLQAARAVGPDAALATASAAAGDAILAHFGVADLATAVLAASGTDAALIVTGMLAAEQPDTPLTSLLVSPAETGSGVPDAVQGRHFSNCTPSGRTVAKGGLLDGLRHVPRLATITLRDAAGAPCTPQEIAAACEAAIVAALRDQAGAPAPGRVVLHAIDGSKTGLTAPDRPTLLRLVRRFGPSLDVVIDACQARIEPALIRWYLQQGFPVLVTGSKFFAAPGFCGAVLFPRARSRRIAANAVPAGLAAYAGLADGIGSRLCPGLLLRWTAALHSMAAFGELPADTVGRRLDRLGHDIVGGLRRDGRLHLVPAPRPEGFGWSDRRSVFTFAVRGRTGWQDAASLRALYLALHDDLASGEAGPRCQVGQPVQLGSPALGGLRLALSAAQICEAGDQAAPLAAVLDRLRVLLDRADAFRVGTVAALVG